ncbi:MAG: DUF89 family protein [Euryarchaeota archaeon]|nr:DUF89 family protein [Euryarchaeota archaeon]
MRVGEACYSCLLDQGRRVLELCSSDGRLMRRVEEFLAERYSPDAVPALLGTELHRFLREITGNPDPFREVKREANRTALRILPHARRLVAASGDRFTAAVRVSLAGNLMDFAVYGSNTCEEALARALEDEPAIDHTPRFRRLVERGGRLLYLLDNAGEIALDGLLIEELQRTGVRVTAAVKGAPVLNDATLEDARQVGLERLCRVVTTGGDVVGVDLERAPAEFLEEMERADVIVAKGQGHFETLDTYTGTPVVFLLRAKCPSVAGTLGVPRGSGVVLVKNA